MHLLHRTVVSVMLLALGACGGGDLTLPSEGQPAQIKALSGDDQTGTILEPAQDSLVVRVTDPFGSPVAGVEIAWAATGGGEVQPASVVTGADGRAATQRVLGDQPGEYGTTAATTMLPDAVVTFTTTAVAAKLVLVTQPAATSSSGAVIAPGPVIQLQDASGNSLARDGVSVTAQIASGQGSLRGTTSRSTNASGQVAFDDLAIVGGPGARTLIFAAPGYAPAVSTPVSLGVGAPATVAIAAGDGQTATGGTALPIKPAVVVRDAGGTPVAGLAVTFAVASGGGSIEGGSATTGADGVATAGHWTLGAVAGPNTLQATVAAEGVSGNPVTFTATAVVGTPSPDKSTVSATPGTIAASQGSAPSTITVTVRDAAGNPLAGQPVSLAATGAGVSLAQPGTTDGSGTTTATFSATGAGPHTVTAATGSITLGSTTVTVTPGAPDPSRVSVSVPSGTAGSATQVQMTLQDQFGNPVVGAAGQISVVVSGANAKGSLPIVEQGGGGYSATYTPVRVGTDQVDVRVGGTPVPGSPFASAVAAGAPDPNHTTADVPDGTVAQQIEIIVHVRDGQDNPVGRGGDHVTVAAAGIGLAVQDRGDGTYRAVWSVFLPGKYPVVITLNGAAIKGSPYSTHIKF